MLLVCETKVQSFELLGFHAYVQDHGSRVGNTCRSVCHLVLLLVLVIEVLHYHGVCLPVMANRDQ